MVYDLLPPFLIGFLGSLHCLGMCGPLVMAYSLHICQGKNQGAPGLHPLWNEGIFHHLAFQSGRVLTYGFLGALAASLAQLVDLSRFFSGFRSGITLGGGILMVLLGLVLLKVMPVSLFSLPSPGPESFWRKIAPPLFQSRRLISKFALLFATGFLPCMLSWAMVVKAATPQHPLPGFLPMVFFGLGTVPALFLTGLSASLLSMRTRFLGERVAAASIIAMGLILIIKGSKYFA